MDVTKAEVGRAETMLGYARILAPYDGKVAAQGEPSSATRPADQHAGGRWLFTVARSILSTVLTHSEADAGLIQLEKSDVHLNVPALAAPVLKGPPDHADVLALEPARTLRAEIDVPNKGSGLVPARHVCLCQNRHAGPESWTPLCLGR